MVLRSVSFLRARRTRFNGTQERADAFVILNLLYVRVKPYGVVSRDAFPARNLARRHVDELSPYGFLRGETTFSRSLELSLAVIDCTSHSSWVT